MVWLLRNDRQTRNDSVSYELMLHFPMIKHIQKPNFSAKLFLGLSVVFSFNMNEIQAQFVVHNNGADVTVSTDCIVSIVTGDLNNASGTLDNAGRITVEGTVTNGDILTGAGTNTGIFSVSGDWINNGSFTAAQSLVNLNGANQEI
jgi:formylmethanofuran dehydrogenase subunit C